MRILPLIFLLALVASKMAKNISMKIEKNEINLFLNGLIPTLGYERKLGNEIDENVCTIVTSGLMDYLIKISPEIADVLLLKSNEELWKYLTDLFENMHRCTTS